MAAFPIDSDLISLMGLLMGGGPRPRGAAGCEAGKAAKAIGSAAAIIVSRIKD